MRFWLDAGCDGFRVDMADSLVKKDDENKSGTSLIWQDIRRMLDESYPEAALVSEWNRPWLSIPAGFHMDFCLDWPGNCYNLLLRDAKDGRNNSFFHKESSRSVLDFFDEYLESYEKIKHKGRYCLITGNHDTIRAAHFLDVTELKLAYAFLFTMPGNPFLYYGDEIGMRYLSLPTKEGGYTRTGSRTPMQWDDTDNHGFSDAAPENLYLPVDSAEDAPTAAAQKADKDSLWHVVKDVLAILHLPDHKRLCPKYIAFTVSVCRADLINLFTSGRELTGRYLYTACFFRRIAAHKQVSSAVSERPFFLFREP